MATAIAVWGRPLTGKVPQAQTVAEYRPITIIIMPYACRVYTTLRSREALQHLKPHMPPTLLENIPGRHTLWWSLQHRIEMALQASEPLTGATSDLVKAFYHLPREVTFQVANCMDVRPNPPSLVCSHGALEVVPAIAVSSGYLHHGIRGRMLTLGGIHGSHQRPATHFPAAEPSRNSFHYVDSYELHSEQVSQTTAAIRSLHDFCGLLDVQLDAKKMFRWACTCSDSTDSEASSSAHGKGRTCFRRNQGETNKGSHTIL